MQNTAIYIFTATILACSPSSKLLDSDCRQVQNGFFLFENERVKHEVYRKDSIQIEKGFDKTNSSLFENIIQVNWVNDCMYELTVLESTSPYFKAYIGMTYSVEILDVTEAGYIYHCDLVGEEYDYDGLYYKVDTLPSFIESK